MLGTIGGGNIEHTIVLKSRICGRGEADDNSLEKATAGKDKRENQRSIELQNWVCSSEGRSFSF